MRTPGAAARSGRIAAIRFSAPGSRDHPGYPPERLELAGFKFDSARADDGGNDKWSIEAVVLTNRAPLALVKCGRVAEPTLCWRAPLGALQLLEVRVEPAV